MVIQLKLNPGSKLNSWTDMGADSILGRAC
jgi:hypothetical protein